VDLGQRHQSNPKVRLDGRCLYGRGAPGGLAGPFGGPQSISVDPDGNLYLADVFNSRVQKFRPKPGADPAKVVGQEARYRAGRTD
jgi:hypothetical protein